MCVSYLAGGVVMEISLSPGEVVQYLVGIDESIDDVATQLGYPAVVYSDSSAHVSLLRNTVIEELSLALEHRGIPTEDMQLRTKRMCKRLMLLDKAETHPTQLSGGQTRRLAIGAVAISDPEVLVLCDPLAGLDGPSQEAVVELVGSLSRTAVIVLAHRPDCRLGGEVRGELPRVGQTLPGRIAPGSRCIDARVWGERTFRRRWLKKQVSFAIGPVEFELRTGAVCWINGANGAGKSTILRALAGLEGKVETAASVSLALQSPFDQVVHSSIGEMIAEPLLLQLPDIVPDVHPLDLSTAQLRLVQVAAVVAQNREIVALDEPDSYVGPEGTGVLHGLIARALEKGAAVVLTSHDPGFVEEIRQYAEVSEMKL